MFNMFGLILVLCLSHNTMMAASDSLNTSIPERATPQGADATVLRQLLNQETLIRMSVEKNVHVLMKDMVSLKDSLLSLQSEMAGIRQIAKDGIADSKEKIEGLKSELQGLEENLEERLVEQNKTGLNLFEKLTKFKNEMNGFQTDIQTSLAQNNKNTSEVLSDIKVQVRLLSTSLMGLDQRVKQLDQTVPTRLEENYKMVSSQMSNISANILEKTNKSLHSLKSEIAETKYDQLKLSAAILSLEWFRNNISSGLIDSKAPMVVAFTAGVTESKRYWRSGNLMFSTIIYNEGGAYDASTGVFTSPTDGIFVFYVTITAYSSNTIYVDIVKNRSSSVRALAYGGTSHQTGTNMAVFSLRRGDKVWVKYHSGQGFYTDSTPITSFTGFMIS